MDNDSSKDDSTLTVEKGKSLQNPSRTVPNSILFPELKVLRYLFIGFGNLVVLVSYLPCLYCCISACFFLKKHFDPSPKASKKGLEQMKVPNVRLFVLLSYPFNVSISIHLVDWNLSFLCNFHGC